MAAQPTRELARFVLRSRWSELPAAVRHEAARAFVNWVGCAFGGARHPAMESAVAALRELSDSTRCAVLGRDERFGPLEACLLNGLSASAHAYDDTHLSTIGHPTAPTVAALLAQAQASQRPVAGVDFLHALVLSNELQTRLSCALALEPAHCHVGLYMTGLTGAAGVAAAVARLMGLDEQQMVWAIGTGATQGSGFRASHASMCSGFIPAHAGRSGLLAARLAAHGFSCNDAAVEAPNGFLDVYGAPPNPDALTRGLGEHWECMNVAAKPWPAGCFIHPTIDVCLAVASKHAPRPQEIERIELRVHRLGLGLTGKPQPLHGYDAQVSVYHWAAATLQRGRAGLAEAADDCVNDPAVVRLRGRVTASVDEALAADEATVTVTLRDGRRIQERVSPCLGSAGRPMGDEQIEAKFIDQVAPALGSARARELAARCWNVETAPDVARVVS